MARHTSSVSSTCSAPQPSFRFQPPYPTGGLRTKASCHGLSPGTIRFLFPCSREPPGSKSCPPASSRIPRGTGSASSLFPCSREPPGSQSTSPASSRIPRGAAGRELDLLAAPPAVSPMLPPRSAAGSFSPGLAARAFTPVSVLPDAAPLLRPLKALLPCCPRPWWCFTGGAASCSKSSPTVCLPLPAGCPRSASSCSIRESFTAGVVLPPTIVREN
ncbi:hypothetical protein T484DRAFT_1940099 [Baffinella frigidus]|nr:hypothetical protein T484DRAFT_1940099 [Cryptophyta sp. CCMP2293]